MTPAELLEALGAVARRVLALAECDPWSRVLVCTYLRGEMDVVGFAILVQARGQALALAVSVAAVRGRVTFRMLAMLCSLDAVHAVVVSDMRGAERSVRHAQHHLDAAAMVSGSAS